MKPYKRTPTPMITQTTLLARLLPFLRSSSSSSTAPLQSRAHKRTREDTDKEEGIEVLESGGHCSCPCSFSCVVVPPPVPAARARFEAHVTQLVRHVQPLIFITLTSHTPYFNSVDAEREALAGTQQQQEEEVAGGEWEKREGGHLVVSATQQALSFVASLSVREAQSNSNHRNTDSPSSPPPPPPSFSAEAYTHAVRQINERSFAVVLTVTATRATAVSSSSGGGSGSNSLTGASKSGVKAVMSDFLRRMKKLPEWEKAEAAATAATSGDGLMVLRGDDGGYWRDTQLCHEENAVDGGKTMSLSPYKDFADGTALLSFIAETAPDVGGDELTLCVGGYPQGHCMDRIWCYDDCFETRDGGTEKVRHYTQDELRFASWKFLAFLDKAHAASAIPYRPPAAAAAVESETIEEIVIKSEKILQRVRAARQLREVPSSYPPEVSQRCIRELVTEKLLPSCSTRAGHSASARGAVVVVTQMLTSAEEFIAYAQDVLREVQRVRSESNGLTSSGSSSLLPAVMVVPGVMAPLRAEDLARVLLQLKVIPGEDLYRLLVTYEDELTAAIEALRSLYRALPEGWQDDEEPIGRRRRSSRGTEGDSVNDDTCTTAIGTIKKGAPQEAVRAFHKRKEAAEQRCREAMEQLTLRWCLRLCDAGFYHFNFSAFSYDCASSLAHVAQCIQEKRKWSTGPSWE